MTAFSVEFVAKPEEARRAETTIPKAVAGALKDVTGFAGCLVLISEMEARLVTVVTLWTGADRAKRCSENVRWVHALLKPYVDRRLRVQTLAAYLPLLAAAPPETICATGCSMTQDLSAETEEETVCVA